MGVADCACAATATSIAAPVMKLKSFAISCFLLICINATLLKMVAIIPTHPAPVDLAQAFLVLCTS
jgi:hypothetical protein